ncbi:M3 family oligoendopeptidase [Halomarina pelagica]|uniref:M3 family oligoendopeptidase n=1 Tax=Halomarina pelagica TaxID=2961599 RepID=UPI0020C3FADF|nr:M3 family metallopeptidase [Halomarina sp. BND7]
MNQLPTRADIDEKYKWDLSAIFDSVEEWESEWSAVYDRLGDLREYEGRVAQDGEALLRALQLFGEVLRRTQRLRLYAQLKRNEDTENSAHQERLHESNRLDREVTKVTDMVRREIQATGRETIMQAVETTEELEVYKHLLDDVLQMGSRARSSEVENLLADFTEVIESPTRVYSSLTNNDIEPQSVETPGGEQVEVTGVNLGNYLRHRDRTFRRRTYQSVYEEYAAVKHTIATAYADNVKAQVALADARSYDSVREMAFNKPSYPETGLHIHLPVEVHDTLTTAVRDSLDPLHQYYERRKAILGLDELKAWDLDVPLADAHEPTVAYEEARDHILTAVEPLGDSYKNQLDEFFASQRIDVYETRNKQNILAYGPLSYDTGSYILLNYQNDVRSMSILAHELGHAMHAEYLREAQSPAYATGTRPIEEVPSYVHEILLAHHLLNVDDYALRQYARDRLLDVLLGIYGSTLHSLFTHKTYRTVEDGEDLTLDRIEEIYTDLLSEFRGPMEIDTWAKRGWLVGSHGRLPYHFYQYTLGTAGALRTVEQLLDGTVTPNEYHDFLRAGGTVRSVEAFETLGLDIQSREPFERACSVVEKYVEELGVIE